MKTIILVRHAKSSWEYDVIDHDRPLKNRGISDAHIISNKIKKEKLLIDKVLSSDAMRAKTTANIFIENLEINKSNFSLNHGLYDFSGENLLEIIKSSDKTINNLMVFGHNHAITHFVNQYGDKYIDNVPTSGLVVIEFDIDNWIDLKKGKTTKTLFPRDFK